MLWCDLRAVLFVADCAAKRIMQNGSARVFTGFGAPYAIISRPVTGQDLSSLRLNGATSWFRAKAHRLRADGRYDRAAASLPPPIGDSLSRRLFFSRRACVAVRAFALRPGATGENSRRTYSTVVFILGRIFSAKSQPLNQI